MLRKRAPRGAIRLPTLAAAATQGQVLCRSPQGAHTHRSAERCTRCCEWPNCRPARTHGRHRWQRRSRTVTSSAPGRLLRWPGDLERLGPPVEGAVPVRRRRPRVEHGFLRLWRSHLHRQRRLRNPLSPDCRGNDREVRASSCQGPPSPCARAWRTVSTSRGSPAMTDVPRGLARSYRTTSFSRPGCPCPSWAAARLVRPTEQRATTPGPGGRHALRREVMDPLTHHALGP